MLFLTQQQKIQGSAFLQNNNPTLGARGLSFHIPHVTMLWGRSVFTPLYGQGAQAWTVGGLAQILQEHMGTASWHWSQNSGPGPVSGSGSEHPPCRCPVSTRTFLSAAQSIRTGVPVAAEYSSRPTKCQVLDLPLTLGECLPVPRLPQWASSQTGSPRGPRVVEPWPWAAQSPRERVIGQLRPWNCQLNILCLQGCRAYAFGEKKPTNGL